MRVKSLSAVVFFRVVIAAFCLWEFALKEVLVYTHGPTLTLGTGSLVGV